MYPNDEPEYKRFFLAIFLAAIVLLAWQAKVEWPRRQMLAHMVAAQGTKDQPLGTQRAETMPVKDNDAEENASLTHEQRLAASPRVSIRSEKLHGSINLKGARFDDVTLAKYRETLDPDSPEVTLFAPNGEEEAYFAQPGWLSQDGKTKVPDQHALWQADKKTLTAGDTVTLSWNNGEGVNYLLSISLDEDYMFSIAQRVENHSGHAITVTPYAYINRVYQEDDPKVIAERLKNSKYGSGKTSSPLIHEGPLGVMNGTLNETNYKELREKGSIAYDDVSGWLGITDKYWLSALIPDAGHYKATFSHYSKGGRNRYQADYLDTPQTIDDGGNAAYDLRLFAGAKELPALDRYATGDEAQHLPPIALFDRSVDFGSLYFLTKPMFLMLNFFYTQIGNFGLAIMLLTIAVKLCMYPLATKSFHATSQMRALQPEMVKLRERYGSDQITLQKETMALYKREKVNPASGCLPVMIQMPVFFALYKVLFVTIEMRHAPFFGWIRDLSVADPSNLFTAFGLIDWTVPFGLHVGVLPLLMCATMVVQMRQQPKPADPTQAKIMTYMPYFFLIIFSKMPAGLVVYWTWSNTISILQQRVITARYNARKNKLPTLKAA